MSNKNIINEIDMEAGAGVYIYFKTLPLSIESCLGELVDNAIASYITHLNSIPDDYVLRVDIKLDHNNKALEVKDNAFGISQNDMKRAFKTGVPPEDATQLNEFGAGMKVSSFWFGDRWTVHTSAIGESHQSSIICDLASIELHGTKTDVGTSSHKADLHGTEIYIEQMSHFPHQREKDTILYHLGSKFRKWLGEGTLELTYDGIPVTWVQPKLLHMQSVRNYQHEDWKSRPKETWKKEINYKYDDGREISGFVGLLESPDSDIAGFNLIRRGRVIQGGAKAWKPGASPGRSSNANIFEHERSFMFARLYGEFHFKGFRVDNHKTKIEWSKDPDPDTAVLSKQEFLSFLYKEIKKVNGVQTEFWYQLQKWKVALTDAKIQEDAAAWEETIDDASGSIQDDLETDFGSVDLKSEPDDLPDENEGLSNQEYNEFKPIPFPMKVGDEDWLVVIKPITLEEFKADWFDFQFESEKDEWPQRITIRVNLAHKFSKEIFRLGEPSQNYEETSPAIYKILVLMAIKQRQMVIDAVSTEMPGTYSRALNAMINKLYKRRV